MKEKIGCFIMIYYLCNRINKRNKPIAAFLDRVDGSKDFL